MRSRTASLRRRAHGSLPHGGDGKKTYIREKRNEETARNLPRKTLGAQVSRIVISENVRPPWRVRTLCFFLAFSSL